jgi:rhodanese-related sulfurtransferase/rubrerythrin
MFRQSQPVANMTVDQLRQFISSHAEEDYVLVDVREPEEYGEEHIPGAQLVPLMDLLTGSATPKPARHVIFYCRSGARSMRGAQAFSSGAPDRVYNLSGGIMAWRGETLKDFPNVKVFEDTEDLQDLLLRAMDLEKGAELLYGALLDPFKGTPQEALIQRLEDAEEGHARAIYGMLQKVSEEPPAPFEELYGGMRGLMLESGEPLVKFTAWLASGTADRASVLELALDLELKAYDLYRNLAAKTDDPELKAAFLEIAATEQRHARTVTRGLGQLAQA